MTPGRIIHDNRARHDPTVVLDEVQRIALDQLCRIPGDLLHPVEASLRETAQRESSVDDGRVDLAALLEMRRQSARYAMRYRQLLGLGFEQLRGHLAHLTRHGPLSLVLETELESHIAAQRMAQSLAQRYARPLDMLDARFEGLARDLGAPEATNPIGTVRLVSAFVATFVNAQTPPLLRDCLLRHYESELGKVLGDLYGRLNTQLAAAGYSSNRPKAVPTRAAGGGAAAQPESLAGGRGPHAGDAADAPLPPADLGRLRMLLRSWRDGGLAGTTPAESAPQRRPAPRRPLRVDEVQSMAALLQGEDPAAFADALGGRSRAGLGAAIRGQLVEYGRRLGIDPDNTNFDADEEDAIDLVGLLFESLFQTRQLLGHAERLYARLVLPYVKVALADRSLFAKRAHPARRMLDALTEVCEGNDGQAPQERDTLERAVRAVHRVIVEYNEDLAVFELATAELEALLEQQRQRVETMERRSVESAHGRERLTQARAQAHAAVTRTLEGARVTAPTAEFLRTYWQQHLMQILLRETADSPECAEAMAIGEAILKADAASAAGHGHDLADRLIALQPVITTCLGSSGLDESAARAWTLDMLRALVIPDAPRDHYQPLVAEPEFTEPAELRLVGGNASLDFHPETVARLRGLRPGSWLRLQQFDEPAIAAKVAWVSPLSSRFLLVNKRGARVLVASAEQLAVLAEQGALQVGASMAPVDEAMQHVESRLAGTSRLH